MKLDAKNAGSHTRPLPFWSLNERLNTEETVRQVDVMHAAGMGGFFMHARGGLETTYMGEEWFDNLGAATQEANRLGLESWAYDENGWPSGFGNGYVNGLGEIYQQKYLRIEKGEGHDPHTVVNADGYHLYYEVNPFYVDLLDKKVTDEFIRQVYEPYYQHFGNTICGFFTDEPQLSRNGMPWSLTLPDTYRTEYGEDLLPLLPQLFYPIGEYEKTRFRFWKLVTRQFSESYAKTLYDWCDAHGMQLTGHMVLEEDMLSQLVSNGAVMPNYEFFHMPGMDWLCRYTQQCLTPLQVGSVAHQMGRKQVLSESGAMSGHGMGLDMFKGMMEWQMVRGVTRLCPHLEGYSMRGIRKRDHPPALYFQQPWWETGYPLFAEMLARTGEILGNGRVAFDTLLIHTQSSAWVCYDDDRNEGLMDYHNALMEAVTALERKHIRFHLGDETVMERHARVEDGALVIGTQRYTRVVLLPHKVLFDSTRRLLAELLQTGGQVLTVDQVDADDLVDCPEITCTERLYDDCRVYYFVNTSEEVHEAVITRGSRVIDALTGESRPFDGRYTFRPYDSLIVVDDGTPQPVLPAVQPAPALPLDGEWKVAAHTPNALLLDTCDYYFDGELIEKSGYVLNIQERACALERPVDIRVVYHVTVDEVPRQVQLVTETPEKYTITVNGKAMDMTDQGYYLDTSFRCLNLNGLLQKGENTIEACIRFTQSEQVYHNLRVSRIFETEKNKLTYDTEVEAMYIVGDFGVSVPAQREMLPLETVRYTGDFRITALPERVKLTDLQEQGFPFFAGSLTLRRDFTAADDVQPALRFLKNDVNVVLARVNGGEQRACVWEPLEIPLTEWHEGYNTVEITLVNNLRNLLGPHHHAEGELTGVAPCHFFKEPCVWTGGNPWADGYALLRFGITQRD